MVNSLFSKEDLLDNIKLNNAIINSVPIGFCITNDKGIYEFVNKAYCKMYGYEKEELIGEHFSKVTIKENTAELIETHDKFLNEGSELKKQWIVKKKSGEKWFFDKCCEI